MREIFGTICLAGAIQAVLLFFVLLVKKNNRKANKFLSIFLIFFALDVAELYLASRGHIISNQPYQFSIIPYSYIFGPSILLFTALLTARIKTISKKHLLLYAPFLTALIFNIIILFTYKRPQSPQTILFINMIINGGGLIFEAILYITSLCIIQKYTIRLKEYFSAIDALKLTLFRIVLSVLTLSVLLFFISLMLNGHIRRDYKFMDIITILFGLTLGFVIVFIAMIQPEIFDRVRLMENAVPNKDMKSSPKYTKLRLSSSKEEEYVNHLKEYMTQKKPYLNEDLTLQSLADGLSLSTHHLSMILNIHFKQNFYNFINSYRIDDVKQKLTHPDYKDQSILSIAYNAGFNSKSTFNTMFKKFTGKTPREYRTYLSN